jgi:hypothetical protein
LNAGSGSLTSQAAAKPVVDINAIVSRAKKSKA